MNKKKSIIIGIFSLALVMVVGYALFSDTITINGTASAEGEFSLTATCNPGITSELYDAALDMAGQVDSDTQNYFKQKLDEMIAQEGGYDNDTCSVNGNKVSFSSNLNFPGATRYFSIKVTNTGSIPFHLKSTNLQNSSLEGTVTATDGMVYDASKLFSSVKTNLVTEPEMIAYDGTISEGNSFDDLYIAPGESAYYYSAIRFVDDTKLTNTKEFNAFDINATETHEFVYEQKTN